MIRPSTAGWLFAGPALAVIALFFGVPVLAAFALSLTDFDIYALADLSNLRFVGLRNYWRLLETPLFWKALGNTLFFVVVGVPTSIALSLGSALLLNSAVARFKGAFRTALFAGDRHSLSATPEQLKDPAFRPDVMLTELTQVLEVIG